MFVLLLPEEKTLQCYTLSQDFKKTDKICFTDKKEAIRYIEKCFVSGKLEALGYRIAAGLEIITEPVSVITPKTLQKLKHLFCGITAIAFL